MSYIVRQVRENDPYLVVTECIDYDHSLIQAQFSLNEEILAFPIRSELGEIDYKDNNPDLDERLKCILSNSRNILEITTSFEIQARGRKPYD